MAVSQNVLNALNQQTARVTGNPLLDVPGKQEQGNGGGSGTGTGQAAAAPDIGGDIGAGLLSAGNSLLFNLPEFIYRRVGGEGADKAAKDYIAKHQGAWTAGDIAGSLGSAFIPGVGLAGTLGKGAKLGSKIVAGALTGGAENAIRNVGASDVGGEAQAAKSGFTGGLIPGALGGVGSAILGKAISGKLANAPKELEELADAADSSAVKALIPGMNARSIRKAVSGNPLTGGKYSAETIEKAQQDLAERLRGLKDKEGVIDMATLKGLLHEDDAAWQQVSAQWDALVKKNPNLLANNYQKVFSKIPEVQDYLKLAKAGGNATPELKLMTVLKQADVAGSLNGAKGILDGATMGVKRAALNSAEGVNVPEMRALGDALYSIRSHISQSAMNMAGVDPDISAAYKAMIPLRHALINDAAKGGEAFGENSKTFLAGAMNAALSGGGAALGGAPGAIAANLLGSAANKISTKVANSAVGSAALGARPAIEKMIPTAEKIAASKVPEIVGKAENAITGGGLANAIVNPNANLQHFGPDVAEPKTEQKGKKAEAKSEDGGTIFDTNSKAFADNIEKGIQSHWAMQGGTRFDPDFSSDEYKQFHDTIIGNLSSDPERMAFRAANVLFPGREADKAQYLKVMEGLGKLSANYDVGSKATGLLGGATAGLPVIGNPEAAAARGAMTDAINSLGGNNKEVTEAVGKLMQQPGTKQQKLAKIMQILKRANPEAFAIGGGQ